jgi:hypothetical protein
MNPERPAQRANQPRVRYQPRRLRRTCAILASRFRSIGTFSAKLACIEPIGQGGTASRTALPTAARARWRGMRPARAAVDNAPSRKMDTMLNTYDKL